MPPLDCGTTLQFFCDAVPITPGACGMPADRRCRPHRNAIRGWTEDTTSMVRPVVEGVPLGAEKVRRDRADIAMNVLQYGTAILAIVVVTLLAVVR